MSKLHITSLLRPRAAYKSTTQSTSEQGNQPNNNIDSGQRLEQQENLTTDNRQQSEQPQHLVLYAATTNRAADEVVCISNVEFIPTLEFISRIPTAITAQQHTDAIQQHTNAYQQHNNVSQHNNNSLQQQHSLDTCCEALNVSETSEENLTYTVVKSPNKEEEEQEAAKQAEQDSLTSLSSLSDYLQQEQQEVPSSSLSITTASLTTHFDEPTSSLSSGDKMEQQKDKKTIAALAKSNAQTLISTSSSSQNGEEDEIEEEIEEAIEESLDISESAPEISLDLLPGTSQKKKSEILLSNPISKKQKTKDETLFGIELSSGSLSSSTLGGKDDLLKSKSKSLSDDQKFKIDSDQLSGGKLAQHFVVEDTDESADGESNRKLSEAKRLHSKHDHEVSDDAEDLNSNIQPESLSNQSTANDVSELQDEMSRRESSLEDVDASLNPDALELSKESSVPERDKPISTLSQSSKDKTLQESEERKHRLQAESLQQSNSREEEKKTSSDKNSSKRMEHSESHQASKLESLEIFKNLDKPEELSSFRHLQSSKEETLQSSISKKNSAEESKEMQKSFGESQSLQKDFFENASKSSNSLRAQQLPELFENLKSKSNNDSTEESKERQKAFEESQSLQKELFSNTSKSSTSLRPQQLPELFENSKTKDNKNSAEESKEMENPLKVSQSLQKDLLTIPSKPSTSLRPQQLPELFENPNIQLLSGASSLHSEKDHSIEEMIATNQSMEMTFDDQDLSSLNPSFDIHNETMVNELLSDTPDKIPSALAPIKKKTNENMQKTMDFLQQEKSFAAEEQSVEAEKRKQENSTPERRAFENKELDLKKHVKTEHEEKEPERMEVEQNEAEYSKLQKRELESTEAKKMEVEEKTLEEQKQSENKEHKQKPKEKQKAFEKNLLAPIKLFPLRENQEELSLLSYSPREVEKSKEKSKDIPFSANESQEQENPKASTSHNYSSNEFPFEDVSSSDHQILDRTINSEMITDLDDSFNEAVEEADANTTKQNLQTPLAVDCSQQLFSNQQIQEEYEEEEDDEDTSLQLMKLRILAMKHQINTPNSGQLSPNQEATTNFMESSTNHTQQLQQQQQQAKPMERVGLMEFSKDVLEDITEESERNSLSLQEEAQSLTTTAATLTSKSESKHGAAALNSNEADSSNSVISVQMVQMLEQKVGELQHMVSSKDACLASLNLQLENMQRRDSLNHNTTNNNTSSEQLGSGRDSSSIVTNSTEYRTFQDDFGQQTMDIYVELSKRDEIIAKLTDSLQQSLHIRENLQSEGEKLANEVQMLRKQLTDAMETLKKPNYWPPRPDQESNCGQRISEISMDLISESDDDLERHYLTDNEESRLPSRNSRERQLSLPRQYETMSAAENPDFIDSTASSTMAFSKQIEQFQKYLTPNEVRLFFMVQKKFDDYLCQELEKHKKIYDQELKIVMDQWETEKREKDVEIKYLLQSKQDKDVKHQQEMEDLRKYFETKCADLEKQFSDDVFSQKSQRHDMTSSSASECSDQEQFVDDVLKAANSKETSPRKRSKAELLLSPSHRQMTPGNELLYDDNRNEGTQLALEITELKSFYQNKIHEIQRHQEEHNKKLSDKLKYYESRYPEDDFMSSTKNSSAGLMNQDSNNSTLLNETLTTADNTTEELTQITVKTIRQVQLAAEEEEQQGAAAFVDSAERLEIPKLDLHDNACSPVLSHSGNLNNNNASLIIIDQDELTGHNEAQIIQKIIEEYERRLQEQLTLAREDIVHELETQIQTLLSETTADDQHWPKELILLREKFTAKSQLEIAQLQIRHAEEMSRLKQDYEKQLNRKNKRHSTFDSIREYDRLLSERDNLRDLAKAFRQVLSELAKCVSNCENDLNETLLDEVQRLLSCNRTVEEHYDADATLLLNDTLNSTKLRTTVPDVNSILEVIEDPNLLDFISNKTAEDYPEDFDLKECLERLRAEASYLLHLSEDLASKKQHSQHEDDKIEEQRQSFLKIDLESAEQHGAEKRDSCCEIDEDGLKSYSGKHKFMRVNSMNEQQLSTHQKSALISQSQIMTSLPVYFDNASSCSPGNSASELNFQLVELKNRLVKSESDRLKLQHELDHTINRNAELGQELQHLRDQLSQLNSLNHIEYNEGYGLGSMKSPQRLHQQSSNSEHSSSSFALLQEKARNILSTPPTIKKPQQLSLSSSQQQQQQLQLQNLDGSGGNDSTVQLLQMIEDFCREGDKVVESSKKDKEDLQSQIEAADKQLKATRKFLEEQALEREQERDEFLKEIERLKLQLKDKEKERTSYANASEEVKHLESQVRDLTQKLQDSSAKCDKFETELKASIDKIFVLREIITDLETQVGTKSLSEQFMGKKVEELEQYIASQSQTNETLQHEVQNLRNDIEHGYQLRIAQLEEKLQNIRPSAEQSLIMDQVVEQLHDIEVTLEQKTKTLETLHQTSSNASNSCSLTEDVSLHGAAAGNVDANRAALHQAQLNNALGLAGITSPQGSPVHPSPRQHSLTMEGVQRVMDKLQKHTRLEEAATKRIRDLEMQVQQMRSACVELQHERESLQERMSEQTQRISTLQTRLEEQRQRAEELQRSNTSDLNIRIQDLQNEVQNLRETLSNRDKQIVIMKQQLEKSKVAIDRLEAELAVVHQPDRSAIEKLEAELKQKHCENQKLKDKIKNEMINKLSLPDLMETMLADKNEEIDHLKEQLDYKEKELQTALDISQASSNMEAAGTAAKKHEGKLSARTLSDIISISEFDEPDVVRRAAIANASSPLLLPQGSEGLHQTMETSKGAIANLTQKRTEELTGFTTLQQANTFEHPHYFQDPNVLLGSAQTAATLTPSLVPRQINFSDMTEDSKLKTPILTPFTATAQRITEEEHGELQKNLHQEIAELSESLSKLQKESQLHRQQKEKYSEELISSQLRLTNLQDELASCHKQLVEFRKSSEAFKQEVSEKSAQIEELLKAQSSWKLEQTELLSKHEKNLKNLQEIEESHSLKLKEIREQSLKQTEREVNEKENLRKELKAISAAHDQCKFLNRDLENRKKEMELLNQEIKTKDERLLTLTTKLSIAEDNTEELQRKITSLEQELEKLRQQNSDHSSKQFSVDEIAKQVEKELNYSAQLDSNILKAIESEEENNLDRTHAEKNLATDDENFVGERELLNQLEALKAQITVEREHAEEMRQELLAEKQHSQELQEQDIVIIEAMRKRLETAMEQEDELHKQLDIERERSERFQTQLTTLQRTESRRNSSLLKSPVESPRKSPRSATDFESELAERLRSEIKLLTAQNERERERSNDLQRSSERERTRYERELQERIEYCEKLKREMEKLARDKDNAEMEIEHLQERLMLQTQEIESLEARITSLQEAETRRCTRKEKQHKEQAQLMLEIQDLKRELQTVQSEKDGLGRTIAQLRFDVERSAQREIKLTEALANANTNLTQRDENSYVPEQFLQKMKEINSLLAENTKENKQMAETVQYLVEERRQLQRKCEELDSQLQGSANITELEERCNHLLGRYLRVESHRKALVYQKRYLKISLQTYQDNEQRALAAMRGGQMLEQKPKKKLFKTVALAIMAIQRMKYIGRIWHTGKRIVSKSVFTITQQKRSLPAAISCAAISSTSPMPTMQQHYYNQHQNHHLSNGLHNLKSPMAPLKTPSLLVAASTAAAVAGNRTPATATAGSNATAFEWPAPNTTSATIATVAPTRITTTTTTNRQKS